MARPLRLEFGGALYQLTARGGDRREPIFLEDEDRSLFIDLLAKEIRQQGWLLYQPVAPIDDLDAASLLRKIAGGKELPTDVLIKHLSSGSDPGKLPEEFSEESKRGRYRMALT